jgi:hypothetical protein
MRTSEKYMYLTFCSTPSLSGNQSLVLVEGKTCLVSQVDDSYFLPQVEEVKGRGGFARFFFHRNTYCLEQLMSSKTDREDAKEEDDADARKLHHLPGDF